MKYFAVVALFLILSPGLMAEENTVNTEESAVSEGTYVEGEPVIVSMRNRDTGMFLRQDNPFKPEDIDLANIDFYSSSDRPNYKPRNTIIVGGLLPFIPIRSNIDERNSEDTGLFQKSVSVLLYFKQKF